METTAIPATACACAVPRAAFEECLTVLQRASRHRDASAVRRELALLAIQMRDLDAARHHLELIRDGPARRRSASGL
jgi:hypothetical protein